MKPIGCMRVEGRLRWQGGQKLSGELLPLPDVLPVLVFRYLSLRSRLRRHRQPARRAALEESQPALDSPYRADYYIHPLFSLQTF